MQLAEVDRLKEVRKSEPAILGDYLTAAECAAELNVAPITLSRWRMAKIGPPVTKIGRKVFYKRSSVRQWVASQERHAKSAT
jgi:hypothetical protein